MGLPLEPDNKYQTITPQYNVEDTIIANVNFKITQTLILPSEQKKLFNSFINTNALHTNIRNLPK